MSFCFHLAIHVSDLDEAQYFYEYILGCTVSRRSDTWIDFDFFGHQLSLHQGTAVQTNLTGYVEQKSVPMPHFGVILSYSDWELLVQRFKIKNQNFILPPSQRFEKEAGEQWTMFLSDPSGNALEFKGVETKQRIFQT